MRKRLFSILLALCMVLSLVPTTAFAEDSTEETPVCTCEIACTEETMNTECPVCGAEGALAENCGKHVEPAAEGEASQPEGEKTQEKQDSDMPDTQSEATLAQMSGEGENGIAVQSAGVAIDNTNFPDANFRSFVASSFDEDNDNYLSDTEINAAENINCAKKGISDLTGISHFTALKSLKCFNNQLTALDVSKNTALTSLDCDYNQLTALDVSKNVALTKLHCWGNSLTKLDVSKNTALTSLDCGANQLTTLDVSKNTALTYLDCRSNQLTALDVSKNTALTDLACRSNQLTALDVSKNTVLTYLNCYANQLTALDVSKNTALTYLDCRSSQLTALDVSKNTALTDLDCGNNQLTSLDVSKNTALTDLDCRNNQLTSLDISNTDMSGLDCDGNIYQIVVGNDRTFDLSTLPGNFNVAKTSDWSGGTVSGNTLTVDSDQDTVTYKYDCGKDRRRTFTLKCVESADYANVDAAIAKANNLNKDDYKDFTAVEAAINAVVRGKNITEQSEVDAMAKAIEDAIAALQYKDADYTKVDEAIAKANALNKDDYKDFSAVDSAVNAVVRGKNITEQSEVDAMAKAIEDAIAALQYKGADYTKVDEAIAKANALNKDDYKDFSAVEAAINAVVRGKNINEQSEVDAMAKAIEDAIAALQYKGADYTKVDEAIAKANALNKDDYKDFSGVDSAVNAVVRDKNITEQSEVDAMAKAIEDAIAALQYKGADYTKVDEAIAKANALNKDDYKDFSGVDSAVNAVVRGKNITEQSEVDAMAKAIEDAIAALQYKGADYTKVDEAIAKANALNKDDYKDFSGVEAAVNAVVRGKNITEQSEVDAMAKAIEDAIAALQYKEKPKICKGGKEVKISNGAHEMRIHGKSYGTFTFAWVNDKAGWSIQNADGKYLSFDNGKLVLRDTAYVWKYDAKFYTTTEEKTSFGWGWWGRPSTKVTNWYLVGDGTDLSISKSDTNADVKLYDAMESTEHSFGKWTPAEDGKHTRTCTICGATETGDCTYENGACTVCGALDPDNASVSVSATVIKRTSGGGGWWWWWNRPTTTTWEARITATGTGVDIDKVEYSDDGKHYLTGTSFTSDTEITKFYIRVTDSKGNVTNWLYENGKVTQK